MTIEHDDDPLDHLLHEARAHWPVPAALRTRVLADAAMVQASHHQPVSRRRPALGWLRALTEALGGWPAVSGVTLAGIAGLMLGVVAPDLVDGLVGGQIGLWTGGVDALPEIGLLWEELGDV